MLQVAMAKFFGCSPSQIRDMTMQEVAAAARLADQLSSEGG